MKRIVNKLLANFNMQLVRKTSFDNLIRENQKSKAYKFAYQLNKEALDPYFEYLGYSKAQLRQDLFVLSELNFKKNGYFVEFGATNGVDLSNTYLLEKHFNWTGILAEPAQIWHEELKLNRTAAIETKCVWESSNEKLLFNEVTDDEHQGELSTIDKFTSSDRHSDRRKSGRKYEVETISLNDLLYLHNAPTTIDYLSIDTEGSEFAILAGFDFSKYNIKIITCEHNHTSAREEIHKLLTSKGFSRKFEEFSEFDDWYVSEKP